MTTTPSQTVGPYFAIGLPWMGECDAVDPDTSGRIRIYGTVFDGAGEPVVDHLIETWQADDPGRFADLYAYAGPSQLKGFRGFARCGAEEVDGTYELFTVKPGRVPGRDGSLQAPHIDVSVFARGLLHRCVTRIYFEDEADANAEDPVLRSVPAARRESLLARLTGDGYRFDIRLQGQGETVFFEL